MPNATNNNIGTRKYVWGIGGLAYNVDKTSDVVERIRKLLRLAEDAGATEAEAAAALERANALLIRPNP